MVAADCSILPAGRGRKIIYDFIGQLNWKIFIIALTIHKVAGGTDDDDSYSNDEYTTNADYDWEEESRLREIIVDSWYELVRYLVGLGMCIFALIGLYFHQFASYYFVKKYTKPRETERRIGRVVCCEPLLSSTSIPDTKSKIKRIKKKKKKHHGVVVQTFKGDLEGGGKSTTDYMREEDLESFEQKNYRMLVVYKVSKSRSDSLLCCGPSEKNLAVLNCTNSFATCASGISVISDDDSAHEKINAYRTRSLPKLEDCNAHELNERLSGSMDYMHSNDEWEYFQWFETETYKHVDSPIDLILLQGQPTSACTPEVLESHLEQVGKSHEGQEQRGCCKSIPMVGTGLAITIIVLSLVCFFQIQGMPHPETQRPIGYTVLGAFFGGSIASAYLFARLLFEQYKQKVFLSAFTAPITSAYATYIDKTISEDTNIVEDEFLSRQQQRIYDDYVSGAIET